MPKFKWKVQVTDKSGNIVGTIVNRRKPGDVRIGDALESAEGTKITVTGISHDNVGYQVTLSDGGTYKLQIVAIGG